jgi:hypothetical protein
MYKRDFKTMILILFMIKFPVTTKIKGICRCQIEKAKGILGFIVIELILVQEEVEKIR